MQLYYDSRDGLLVRPISFDDIRKTCYIKYVYHYDKNKITHGSLVYSRLKKVERGTYILNDCLNDPDLPKLYTPLEIIKIRNYYANLL